MRPATLYHPTLARWQCPVDFIANVHTVSVWVILWLPGVTLTATERRAKGEILYLSLYDTA
jgi:hypothetical protein